MVVRGNCIRDHCRRWLHSNEPFAWRKSATGCHQVEASGHRGLTETAIIERTCRILASMLRAGVDLPRSMAVTAESSNNAVYRTALEKIREAMMQGQGLAEPIAKVGYFRRPPDKCFVWVRKPALWISNSKSRLHIMAGNWRPSWSGRLRFLSPQSSF